LAVLRPRERETRGIFHFRREFRVAGGTSMVATTFAADTPLLVTGLVRRKDCRLYGYMVIVLYSVSRIYLAVQRS